MNKRMKELGGQIEAGNETVLKKDEGRRNTVRDTQKKKGLLYWTN